MCDEGQPHVLKRMLLAKGEDVRLAGLREAYFGALLTPRPHVEAPHAEGNNSGEAPGDHLVRFVEAFEVRNGLVMEPVCTGPLCGGL